MKYFTWVTFRFVTSKTHIIRNENTTLCGRKIPYDNIFDYSREPTSNSLCGNCYRINKKEK